MRKGGPYRGMAAHFILPAGYARASMWARPHGLAFIFIAGRLADRMRIVDQIQRADFIGTRREGE